MEDSFALRSPYPDIKTNGKIKLAIKARYSEEVISFIIIMTNYLYRHFLE